MNRHLLLAPSLAALLLAASCGGGEGDDGDSSARSDSATATAGDGGAPGDPGSSEAEATIAPTGWFDYDAGEPWEGDGSGSAGSEVDGVMVGDVASSHESAASATTTAVASEAFDSPTAGPALAPAPVPDSGGPTTPVVQGPLQAGSVDDNATWADYLAYREEFASFGIAVHDVDVSDRRIVTVVDRDGIPVRGAVLSFTADRADMTPIVRTTFADGRTVFFPSAHLAASAGDWTATVMFGDVSGTVHIGSDDAIHDYQVTLDVSATTATVPLDVMFLLDATGSMGDEIDRLKTSIAQVSERVKALESHPDVRFGMTVYRDRGDVFVTRSFDLTADISAFATALDLVEAGGGGDTPESLNAGLHDVVNVPSWRPAAAGAVRLVFLVADAAPHLDYQDDTDYAVEMQAAAEAGIKVFPIASSGLDDQGEYIFRQIAQHTMGRFVFLTYGAGGAPTPGTETDLHVEGYEVLSLDDLVVRLVAEELGDRAGRQ